MSVTHVRLPPRTGCIPASRYWGQRSVIGALFLSKMIWSILLSALKITLAPAPFSRFFISSCGRLAAPRPPRLYSLVSQETIGSCPCRSRCQRGFLVRVRVVPERSGIRKRKGAGMERQAVNQRGSNASKAAYFNLGGYQIRGANSNQLVVRSPWLANFVPILDTFSQSD